MKSGRTVFSIPALVLCAILAIPQDRSQAHKFQDAINLMETKGDYRAAIRLFEEVTKGSDRSLAARSLLCLGLCYEELDKEEARKTYQRLTREFTDQPQVVAEARARLSALIQAGSSKKETAMIVRKFYSGPELFFTTSLSTDGRNIFYTDWETGDLALLELVSGKKRRLTNKGYWFHPFDPGEWAVVPTPSPDGSQVAYQWYNKDQSSSDLRLVGLDGSGPRILCRNEEANYIAPVEWSSDGKEILALFSRKDRTNQIVLVSVRDGSVRALKTLGKQRPLKMSLSPDGRYVIYDFPQEEGSEERDIFLLATDGSYEIPLVKHPANDCVLVWTPDGKRVLFASDRTGIMGLWVMDVIDGKPQGSPELIKPTTGPIWPIAFTPNGSFYYAVVNSMMDVYIAELDPATARILAPAIKVTQPFVGTNTSPYWSPDGKHLVYVTRTVPYDSRWYKQASEVYTLSIFSIETGKHQQLQPRLKSFSHLRWSPDGGSFLAFGLSLDNRSGFYQIDAQTGEVTPILYCSGGSKELELSPDRSAIFYKLLRRPIILRELKTGQEREIYQDAGAVNFSLSRDGKRLALAIYDLVKGGVSLKVMPSAGGELRELMRLQLPEYISAMDWMPDGQGLLFTKGRRDHLDQPQELWRISSEGGEPQRLELATDLVEWGKLRVHPTGQRIAFSAIKYRAEIWMMENFLPNLKVVR
jgi:Tol biopolymer transport system component